MKKANIAALILAISSGYSVAQSTPLPPTPIFPSDVPDVALLNTLLVAKRPVLTFKTDDVLTVQVYGIKSYAEKQTVADDGTVLFPLIGKLPVAGMTVAQVQTEIATALKQDGMVADPVVTISLDSRPSDVVAVLGQVGKPGMFPALGNLTLADYLGQASGFVETTSNTPGSSLADRTVVLIRPALDGPVSIPLGSDLRDARWGRIPIFAGDEIRVKKLGSVYAVGAFRIQGVYLLKNSTPTTVMQLVALAGGVGYEGKSKNAQIVRKSAGSQTVLDVNVAKILKGESPDLPLQADDILFVPPSDLKAAIKGGGANLAVTLASAYVVNATH